MIEKVKPALSKFSVPVISLLPVLFIVLMMMQVIMWWDMQSRFTRLTDRIVSNQALTTRTLEIATEAHDSIQQTLNLLLEHDRDTKEVLRQIVRDEGQMLRKPGEK